MELTGRYYWKNTLFGVRLMVQESNESSHAPLFYRWRAAKMEDIPKLNLTINE